MIDLASANKTPKLGLNNWNGTDTPVRDDFNRDNSLLDNAVGTHNANSSIHLSTADRSLLTNPFTVGKYSGNNANSRTISIGFTPRFGIIFARDSFLCEYVSGLDATNCFMGFLTPADCSLGITRVTNGFSVLSYETGMQSSMPVLNRSGVAYVYVMWK